MVSLFIFNPVYKDTFSGKPCPENDIPKRIIRSVGAMFTVQVADSLGLAGAAEVLRASSGTWHAARPSGHPDQRCSSSSRLSGADGISFLSWHRWRGLIRPFWSSKRRKTPPGDQLFRVLRGHLRLCENTDNGPMILTRKVGEKPFKCSYLLRKHQSHCATWNRINQCYITGNNGHWSISHIISRLFRKHLTGKTLVEAFNFITKLALCHDPLHAYHVRSSPTLQHAWRRVSLKKQYCLSTGVT